MVSKMSQNKFILPFQKTNEILFSIKKQKERHIFQLQIFMKKKNTALRFWVIKNSKSSCFKSCNIYSTDKLFGIGSEAEFKGM